MSNNIIRLALTLLFLHGVPCFAFQHVEFGIKTSILRSNPFAFRGRTDVLGQPFDPLLDGNTLPIGPTFESALPRGLAIEVSGLRRRFSLHVEGSTFSRFATDRTFVKTDASANSWEFPLVLKKYVTSKPIRPYVGGGVAARRVATAIDIAGCDRSSGAGFGPCIPFSLHSSPQNDWSHGFVFGGRVSFPASFVRIAAEVRYSGWKRNQRFAFTGGVRVREDVADVLVSVTLRKGHTK